MATPLWTIDELAERLNVGVSTIRRLLAADTDDLPPEIRIGGSIRWDPNTVEQWITQAAARRDEERSA